MTAQGLPLTAYCLPLTAYCLPLTVYCLVLLCQMGCGTGFTDKAVAVQLWPQLLSHGILSHPASEDPDGGYDEVKYNT